MRHAMLVNQRRTSNRDTPYIIAELSANYGGNIDSAKQSF
jgi:sialic acid synthase SpsE